MNEPTYLRIAAFPYPEEAHLLAGRLQSEGIQAVVRPRAIMDVYGRDGSPLLGGRMEVLVPEDSVREAERIIHSIEDG